MAEYAALLFLMGKAYLPIALRYKTPVGEIDLIMRRGNTLIFVEVKSRTSHDAAATAIHTLNQARVVQASQVFLKHMPRYQSLHVRFDAVLIAWYKWPRHQRNAF